MGMQRRDPSEPTLPCKAKRQYLRGQLINIREGRCARDLGFAYLGGLNKPLGHCWSTADGHCILYQYIVTTDIEKISR